MTRTRDNEAQILALRYLLAYNRDDHDAMVAIVKDLDQGHYPFIEILTYMADFAIGYAHLAAAYEHGDIDYCTPDGAAEVLERSMRNILDHGEGTSQ